MTKRQKHRMKKQNIVLLSVALILAAVFCIVCIYLLLVRGWYANVTLPFIR